MIIKVGAEVGALIPAMWPGLIELDYAWRNDTGADLVITSGTDGQHTARTSDHYRGGAVDIRTRFKGVQADGTERERLFRLVKFILGRDWYVKNEINHFHLSYRPIYRGE